MVSVTPDTSIAMIFNVTGGHSPDAIKRMATEAVSDALRSDQRNRPKRHRFRP